MADVLNLPGARLQLGSCGACGKQRYQSRRAARKASKDLHPDTHMQAYRCGSYWHIGRPFFATRAEARQVQFAKTGGVDG